MLGVEAGPEPRMAAGMTEGESLHWASVGGGTPVVGQVVDENTPLSWSRAAPSPGAEERRHAEPPPAVVPSSVLDSFRSCPRLH